MINDLNNLIVDTKISNEIMNLSSSLYGGVMTSLIGLDITQFSDFNKKNDSIMRYHMMRNDVQKSLLRSGATEGAYIDGDSSNEGIPVPDFSYSEDRSYRQFSNNINVYEKSGLLTTSKRNIDNGDIINSYYDYNSDGSEDDTYNSLGASVQQLQLSGDSVDKDSILYKTQKLFNANKIKSVISKFHTDPSVRYNGQVGSSQYGESKGRNLLTKSAENGQGGNYYNGYENPYCRAWTHHYRYDRLSKTMRANPNLGNDITNSINYWGEDFEFQDKDGKIKENEYSWRGKVNQSRRQKHSVLDEKTGLINIVPKYLGGGSKNIPTKSCMFAIENLAWKDYDPYSYEQALSWEQRGPMGGRIMWFPPYNLKITETTTAQWNRHEFIGRGEPVYTYNNTERTGTLSFTMLVDHPSSLDYSSWFDNTENTDNDYHRYFVGCFDGNSNSGGNGNNGNSNNGNGLENDGLLKKPNKLTDEWLQQIPNLIQAQEVIEKVEEVVVPVVIPEPNKSETVEFVVYYPNNYSGCFDLRGNITGTPPSEIDPMLYLLLGKGAQKQSDGVTDLPILDGNGNLIEENIGYGYEMVHNVGSLGKDENNYVKGVNKKNEGTKLVKKWYYRIDCFREKEGVYNSTKFTNSSNTITQTLRNPDNLVDKISNNVLNNQSKLEGNNYSFAQIACALYSSKLLNKPDIYNKLINIVEDKERVEKLIEIFTTMYLTSIEGSGVSNEHGYKSNNLSLSEQRGLAVIKWLESYDKFKNVEKIPATNKSSLNVEKGIKDVNSEKAKQYRAAAIRLEFSSINTKSVSQTDVKTMEEPQPTPEEILDNTDPIIGKEFNKHNWTLIDDNNINSYTKNGYEYISEGVNYPTAGIWDRITDENISNYLIDGYEFSGLYDETCNYQENEIIKFVSGSGEYYLCEQSYIIKFEDIEKEKVQKWGTFSQLNEGDYCNKDGDLYKWDGVNWVNMDVLYFDETNVYYDENDFFQFENEIYRVKSKIVKSYDWISGDILGVKVFNNFLLNRGEDIENYTPNNIIYDNGYFWVFVNNGSKDSRITRTEGTGIVWSVDGSNSKESVSSAIPDDKWKDEYNKDVQYKKGDICLYENELYVSEYDFKIQREETPIEGQNRGLSVVNGEYKEYFGFRYIGSKTVQTDTLDEVQWDYYIKEPGMIYFEEINNVDKNSLKVGEKLSPTPGSEIEISKQQLNDLINSDILKPTSNKVTDEKSQGNFNNKTFYQKGDLVKYNNVYYVCKEENLKEKYFYYIWDIADWMEINTDNIQEYLNDGYCFVEDENNENNFNVNDVIFDESDEIFKVCINKQIMSKSFNVDDWNYVIDYPSWTGDEIPEFSEDSDYNIYDYVYFDGKVYQCKNFIILDKEYEWDTDLTLVLKYIIYDIDINPNGEFNKKYKYELKDICYNEEDKHYYVCVREPKENDSYEWSLEDWQEAVGYNEYDVFILKLISQMVCKPFDEFIFEYGIDMSNVIITDKTVSKDFNDIYLGYGNTPLTSDILPFKDIYNDVKVINSSTDLYKTSKDNIVSINKNETKMLSTIYGGELINIQTYISVYNLLKNVDYILNENGNKIAVCKNDEQVQKLVKEKKNYLENIDNYNQDCNNVWVDRGDGLLIQECELDNNTKTKNKERSDEDNKIRYDKEYHFYKKYMDEHPFVLQQLREKIKYFNPMFHSMTPEGFNSRLTFLHQCTRQGSTLTRSDNLAGTTANNLVFGRPPFCILRLGDFYHQMIVIESINFDYAVSGDLQWDLNVEGNGVQPMLCDVSINFKFIGGGDIEGPVRRLQNAMTFNYYANTSFYDNRADRHYYDIHEETGIATLDKDKSYSYKPELVKDKDFNITKL